MTNKERIEDLLTEFDEFGMKPTILVPDPEEMAKEWKHELIYAINHLKSEIAREIFEEIESVLFTVARPHSDKDGRIIVKRSNDLHIRPEDYYTIKKKHTK